MKRVSVSLGATTHDVRLASDATGARVEFEADAPRQVRVLRGGENALVLVGDRVVSLKRVSSGSARPFFFDGVARTAVVGPSGGALPPRAPSDANSGLSSPMPGRVVSIAVKPGDSVEPGQLLLVIEAMKMQNELSSPAQARVQAVLVAVGDTVERGAALLRFG
ncbi:MAG: biotin/lipoyl-binding protein [Polyangiaceae bacterium]